MIGKLLIAAALALPGVAAARDAAELQCLRDHGSLADGKLLHDAISTTDIEKVHAAAMALSTKAQPCKLQYRWSDPVAKFAGGYFGALLTRDYLRSELGKRGDLLARLDTLIADMPAERRAAVVAELRKQEDMLWLRGKIGELGLQPGDPNFVDAVVYILSAVRVGEDTAKWKLL